MAGSRHPLQQAIKSLIDRAMALALLLLTSPLMALLALTVAITSGTPILHRETRLGCRGKPFQLRKFRSLAPNSGGGSVAPDDDPRINPVGLFLRRWRFDELPQLWSVLCGEMSLVGPRPMPPRQTATLDPLKLEKVLSVRPGLISAAALQFLADDAALSGRADAEKLYLDILLPAKLDAEIDYLRHWSLLTDLRLLLLTPLQLFSRSARRRSRARIDILLGDRESTR